MCLETPQPITSDTARTNTLTLPSLCSKLVQILREQLSPFDIELRSVERQLDFSDAGKAVSRFLANRNRRLFSLSTENALVTLLREGVSVQESNVDHKRDLEDALRSACNDFIEHTSQNIARDILNFGQQCKALDGSSSNNNNNNSSAVGQQAFMSGGSVKSMLEKTTETLDGKLQEITTQMSLYLDNPATQSILLKPVSKKIQRALEDSRKAIQQVEVGQNGWEDDVRKTVMKMIDTIEKSTKQAAKGGSGGK